MERAERQRRPGRATPTAWLAVLRAQFNLASSPEGSDAETGQLTDRGQQAIIEVAQAWERYLRLKPEKIDSSAASFAALAYGALQDYDKAVETQALSVKARPSANGYFQLADFAYRAGQVETGDRAAKEAVRRTPSRPAQHGPLADQGHEEGGRRIREGPEGGQEGRAGTAEGRW